MLLRLSIHNIVLIEALEIAFGSGLCALTGETGAGKSILLDALNFSLGERAQSRLLRHGAAQGSVTAEYDIATHDPLHGLLHENGIEAEDSLYVRRVLYTDGKTRAFINDVPVSVQLLKRVGEMLVEIHGQHEQRGLLEPSSHRRLLDSYATLTPLLEEVRTTYGVWHTAEKQYTELIESHQAALREEAYIRHVLAELEQLAPQEGEEESLLEERRAGMNQEKLREGLDNAYAALHSGTPVTHTLIQAQKALLRIASGPLEKKLESTIHALERAHVEVSDALAELESLQAEELYDSATLERIEERLFALRAAARKHHCAVEELPALLAEFSSKQQAYDDHSHRLSRLEKERVQSKAAYSDAASRLSHARREAADRLRDALLQELIPLKMGAMRFEVVIEPREEKDWQEHGWDRVYFLASANPGMPLAPLAQVASGGELSRLMLAMKVVLSGIHMVPVMIFDEVDTGIGGAVADAVGERLARLGKEAQLLVVTHQPQVASKASYHLKVQKEERNGHTNTTVKTLSHAEREEEVARMLAGATITEEARAAARKLLVDA